MLSNGIRNDTDAAPIECIGAAVPCMRVVYEKSPVRAAAAHSYWQAGLDLVVSSAKAGAVRLASAADAQRLFATFVAQCQKCENITVALYIHDDSNTEIYLKISDVVVSGPILSATIISWDNHHSVQSRDERAVGVESDVIVDVEVDVRPVLVHSDGRSTSPR